MRCRMIRKPVRSKGCALAWIKRSAATLSQSIIAMAHRVLAAFPIGNDRAGPYRAYLGSDSGMRAYQ